MKKLLGLTLGVALALVLGEQAAAMRDHGGFPHYNGYVADPALGVRLIPDFDTVLAFADNPPAPIHVNHQGYRGADWPEGRTGEIAVIGDSQVFGLGVGDADTLPAQLEAATGRPTLNLGVPTYGPAEYLALIDEVAARQPATIVLVVNFANDLFEIDSPNPTRHVVLDGWAIRGDTLPDAPQFPGRSWLFQKSHLVYAARTLLHAPPEPDAAIEDASPAPLAVALPAPAPAPQAISAEAVTDQVHTSVSALNRAEIDVIRLWLSVSGQDVPYAWDEVVRALRGGARVGDIVEQNFAEESVRIQLTAEWLRTARALQRDAAPKLAEWLAAHPRARGADDARAALDRLAEARAQVAALDGLNPSDGARPSAFRGFLLDASSRARAAGAELAIVALPLDVAVDPAEFKKYGVPEQDLSETRALLSDLCADANRLGARCVDPTDGLRAGNPGMFLNKDIHLTPAGQGVVARALAETLSQPAPAPRPIVGLPPGRSRLPTEEEWQLVPENLVKGSSSNNCQTRTVREYLVVDCKRAVTGITSSRPRDRLGGTSREGLDPLDTLLSWSDAPTYGAALRGLTVSRGPLDRLAWASEDRAVLVIPMLPDREIVADLFWSDRTMRLTVPPGPAAEGQPVGAFEPTPGDVAAPQISAAAPPVERASCAPEQVQAGAARVCLARCDGATPCDTGVCSDWLGMNLCI